MFAQQFNSNVLDFGCDFLILVQYTKICLSLHFIRNQNGIENVAATQNNDSLLLTVAFFRLLMLTDNRQSSENTKCVVGYSVFNPE